MKTILVSLIFVLAGAPALAASASVTPGRGASAEGVIRTPAKGAEPDSEKMEKQLQRLPWKQFRSVVESVPKLKAGIDAYGPVGWQFVEANYRSYGWKKNIDRLDGHQKRELAEKIQRAAGS